jgi:hypothetical protein
MQLKRLEAPRRKAAPAVWTRLDVQPWPQFSYVPEVWFSIQHDDRGIFLQFQVEERHIRALAQEPQGEVWKDTCVEFFASPDGNDLYYNFEFNGIGTTRLSVGHGRHDRRKAPLEVLTQVQVQSSLGQAPFGIRSGDFKWTLEAYIPCAAFFEHRLSGLNGQQWRVNFYKCGDELPEPHYLVWNPIHTPAPDYHRPEYFGELVFV